MALHTLISSGLAPAPRPHAPGAAPRALVTHGHQVTVHDPHADAAEASHEYGLTLDADALDKRYDMVVLAVPHREYLTVGEAQFRGCLAPGGTLADLKGVFPGADWTL